MESEADRQEYVLNDFGYIWDGSAKRNEGLPWTFGQVKKNSIYFSSLFPLFNILFPLFSPLFLNYVGIEVCVCIYRYIFND